jgi:ornithine carbamoyltransferase
MAQLGGSAVFLRRDDTQAARGEPIPDTARSLSQIVDGIAAPVNAHQDLLELARHSSVPVVNALSDTLHPVQALTDLYTLRLRHGRTQDLRIAWVGDGTNVCHELMFGAAKLGIALSVASPAGYEPRAPIVRLAVRDAQAARSPEPALGQDPRAAVQGAQAVFTDTWVSMGQEAQAETRSQALSAYRVTADLMALAAPGAVFLHPLPARRGEEVAAEVIDGPQSLVMEQVRNRLPVTKAILAALLAG